MQEPLPLRDTQLESARELSELTLIRGDLANSLASLSLWTKSYQSEGEDPNKIIIEDSLFRDGITQFVACFDCKNAIPLVVEEIYPEADGIGVYFRWLRQLRNSYTAHRSGAARQCVVGIMIDPHSGAILGHGQIRANYRGPAAEGHADLLRVIRQAFRFVESRIEQTTICLLAEAEAMSAEDRLKLPAARIQGQDPSQMGKSRGDVRKAIQRTRDETFSKRENPSDIR